MNTNANSSVTNSQWLQTATKQLTEAGDLSARLDALVLLEDVTNTNRTHLLAHPELELTDEHVKQLNSLIERRAQHIPLSYLRGKTEFYGREFVITDAVLEPRPESETMIELLIQLDLPASPTIVDVGSGSGALGITAQLELPNAHVELFELDTNALQVSRLNTQKLAPNVTCTQSDLLTAAGPDQYDVVLANLPYVPNDHQINQAAMNEPSMAIFGGPDGLDLYRQLFEQLAPHANAHTFVLTEALPPQHEALSSIARIHNWQLVRTEDFIQVFQQI